MASSSEICDVWIYLPWEYWSGNYTISGYRTSWEHSGANQTDEPTSGTAQNIECRVNAEQAKSVADSAVSTIGNWCYNNDITYINGGKIYTGTVTADKLAANSVTADKILAGAITADKLSVDAITSRNYVKDTSGTKISLADGSYDSKYTKINSEGKISCSNIDIFDGSIQLKTSKSDNVRIRIDHDRFSTRLTSMGVSSTQRYPYNDSSGYDDITSSLDVGGFFMKRLAYNTTNNDYTHKYYIELSNYTHDLQIITEDVNSSYTCTRHTSNGIVYKCGKDKNNLETLFEVTSSGKVISNDDVTTSSGASLNTLKTDLSSLSTTVSSLSTTVSGLSTSVSSLSTSLSTLSNKVYTTDSGLFNTAKALFINGVALSSKWAQLIIEYNGSCFGIRNDGGNTYLMNGNTNGWTNYCSFNTNGNWGFPGNATLPGTLTAGGLVSTGGLYLPGKANAQTTAKPNTYIDSAGNVWKSSTTSSKRFKEDVKPVENMELNPENLYDIDVVQFKYKKDHFTNKEDPRYQKDMIGFIAENVYEHYPMAADYHIGDDGNVVCDGWNEQYLIPAMLKLIQDQHKRILELEKGIQNG